MREKYKKICQSLNIGYWRIDFKENSIHLDHYLQDQFHLNSTTIDLDYFFTLIIPIEKEAVRFEIHQFPEKRKGINPGERKSRRKQQT